jgi:hypothetical protein
MGRGLPLRLPEPRAPLTSPGRTERVEDVP